MYTKCVLKGRFSKSQAQMRIHSAKNRPVHCFVMKSINSNTKLIRNTDGWQEMIASRYNEKHSNFIIAITKSIFITQFSILYHYKGLETHILHIVKVFVKTE